ncbi:MAG: DUF4435 domain-containing protein [Crocosphaera sp.]|nr:DUF4435 domain-containing protein [Crocosphaera sp.]
MQNTQIEKLLLPPSVSTAQEELEIQGKSSIVIVGANGSGKTRLGSWLEFKSQQSRFVHRIAAQKSLLIPDYCQTSSLNAAKNSLFYGYHNENLNESNLKANKQIRRWNQKPNTFLLNDYDKLLVYLFTEEFDKSVKYRQQASVNQQPETPPETSLDIIKRIWEFILPHRELIIRAGKIEVCSGNEESSYHAAEMSDGERVIIYLIGQCLAVKENSIIIIDEPELHLHKALQSRLWDAIETERSDCLFVYLTHDLDFAVTRVNSRKIWLKSYENDKWDWHLISEDLDIREQLLLEIIGSRQPILFVEGDKTSLDFFLFSHLFKNYTIIPNGGSHDVIHATCSFSQLKTLHSLDCKGIIDSDFRTDEQIENLKSKGVFCLDFSEIENLLLSENILKLVAESLCREDVDEIIDKTKHLVFTQMEDEKERLISSIVATQIENNFKTFDAKAIGQSKLQESLNQVCTRIDLSQIYQETQELINRILETKDYSMALRIYDNKGLLPQVTSFFGFKHTKKSPQLINHIKRLLASRDNQRLVETLLELLPEFPEF